MHLAMPPVPGWVLAPERASVAARGPRCRAVGQHSAVAERLSRGAGHGGRTLLQRLIEAAFFLVRVPFNAHIQCPKELHIHNLEEHSPAEGFHYVNKHSDFLGTSSDKKK